MVSFSGGAARVGAPCRKTLPPDQDPKQGAIDLFPTTTVNGRPHMPDLLPEQVLPTAMIRYMVVRHPIAMIRYMAVRPSPTNCFVEVFQQELLNSPYLEASDDVKTQRGIVATAMAIVDRMSNSEKMREVTWKPARVAKMSHKVGLKCPVK